MTIFKIFLLSVLVLFFIIYYLSKLETLPLHPDEHDWVRKADYFDFYIRAQFFHPAWSDYDAYDQPKLASYFFGSLFHFHGWKNISQRLTEIDFNQGWRRGDGYGRLWTQDKWWIKYADYSPKDLPVELKNQTEPILLARKGSLILGLLTLIVIFLIGRRMQNWITGLIAMILSGFNPLFVNTSLLAMADGLLLFLFLLSLFLTSFFVNAWNTQKWQKVILSVLAISLVNGLAAATKFTGFIAEAVFMTFCFLLAFFDSKAAIKNLALSLIFTVAVFVALDPSLWPNPPKKFGMMIAHRILITSRQQKAWPAIALTNPVQRIELLSKKFLLPGGEYSTFHFTKLPVDLILFFLGAFLIVKKEKNNWRRGRISFLSAVVLGTSFLFLILIFWLPMDWERYYLLLIPSIVLIEAFSWRFFSRQKRVTKGVVC